MDAPQNNRRRHSRFDLDGLSGFHVQIFGRSMSLADISGGGFAVEYPDVALPLSSTMTAQLNILGLNIDSEIKIRHVGRYGLGFSLDPCEEGVPTLKKICSLFDLGAKAEFVVSRQRILGQYTEYKTVGASLRVKKNALGQLKWLEFQLDDAEVRVLFDQGLLPRSTLRFKHAWMEGNVGIEGGALNFVICFLVGMRAKHSSWVDPILEALVRCRQHNDDVSLGAID